MAEILRRNLNCIGLNELKLLLQDNEFDFLFEQEDIDHGDWLLVSTLKKYSIYVKPVKSLLEENEDNFHPNVFNALVTSAGKSTVRQAVCTGYSEGVFNGRREGLFGGDISGKMHSDTFTYKDVKVDTYMNPLTCCTFAARSIELCEELKLLRKFYMQYNQPTYCRLSIVENDLCTVGSSSDGTTTVELKAYKEPLLDSFTKESLGERIDISDFRSIPFEELRHKAFIEKDERAGEFNKLKYYSDSDQESNTENTKTKKTSFWKRLFHKKEVAVND